MKKITILLFVWILSVQTQAQLHLPLYYKSIGKKGKLGTVTWNKGKEIEASFDVLGDNCKIEGILYRTTATIDIREKKDRTITTYRAYDNNKIRCNIQYTIWDDSIFQIFVIYNNLVISYDGNYSTTEVKR